MASDVHSVAVRWSSINRDTFTFTAVPYGSTLGIKRSVITSLSILMSQLSRLGLDRDTEQTGDIIITMDISHLANRSRTDGWKKDKKSPPNDVEITASQIKPLTCSRSSRL